MNKLLQVLVERKDYKKHYWNYVQDLTTFFSIDSTLLDSCILDHLLKNTRGIDCLPALLELKRLKENENYKNAFSKDETVYATKFTLFCFLEELLSEKMTSEEIQETVFINLILKCKRENKVVNLFNLKKFLTINDIDLENTVRVK